MSRKYLGAQEVNIPIEDILQIYAAWTDDIVKAVSDELLREVRKNARNDFEDRSGLLRARIQKKKSRFGDDTHIVGAFAPHAHLVEFGTEMRVNKKGKVSGHMPATLFLTAAGQAVEGRLAEIINRLGLPTVEVRK